MMKLFDIIARKRDRNDCGNHDLRPILEGNENRWFQGPGAGAVTTLKSKLERKIIFRSKKIIVILESHTTNYREEAIIFIYFIYQNLISKSSFYYGNDLKILIKLKNK